MKWYMPRGVPNFLIKGDYFILGKLCKASSKTTKLPLAYTSTWRVYDFFKLKLLIRCIVHWCIEN